MNEELNPSGEKMVTRQMAAQAEDTIDLLELFFVLVAHWWQIAVSVVVCAVLFFAYTYFNVAPTYRSTAKMYLVSQNESSLSIMSELQLSTNLKPDYQELLKSRPLLENVIQKLDLPYSTGYLARMISISNPTDTRILWVTVTSNYPAEAADIANELVNQSREYLSDIMKIDPPSFYESALVPTGKAGPNYSRSVLMGGAVGAVASAGFFVLMFLLDDRLETPDDIVKYLGITPLAVVPEAESTPKKKKKKSSGQKSSGHKKETKTDGGVF